VQLVVGCAELLDDDAEAAARLSRARCLDGGSPMGLPLREVLADYLRQGAARRAGAATVLAELDKHEEPPRTAPCVPAA
jgi:hypothetical protein